MHLDGPADRSGRIQEGDILVAVEGESVAGKGLSFLSGRIPGPLNSIVKLTFNHGESNFVTDLYPRTPFYFTSMSQI